MFILHSIVIAWITTCLEMKSYILTFLLVIGPFSVHSEEDGDIDRRIFNGQDAVRGQFPFQARCVQKKTSGGLTFCGGSILSDMWVLSAAHCANGATSVTVYLGLINPKNVTGVVTRSVDSQGIFIHPLYNKSNQNYDAALYKLNESIPFSQYPYIMTISLPSFRTTNVSSWDNYNGTISGWGAVDNAGNSPTVLQWAKAHVMPHDQCVKKNFYPITENMICTDKVVFNTGMCPGDSGGPLAANGTDGVLRVLGTGSWITGGCNSTYSVQYGYVGSQGMLSWIVTTSGVQPK